MLFFIRMIFKFIIGSLVTPEEYNPNSRNFKPLKVIILFLLFSVNFFSLYMVYNYVRMHDFLKEYYPDAFQEYQEYKLNRKVERDYQYVKVPLSKPK